MMRLVRAHWLKTKRTPVRLVCWLLPVVYALLLFFYFYSRKSAPLPVIQEYGAFFLFLAISALFTLSVIAPLIVTPDREAGVFGNELRIGVPRSKLFISRLLLLICIVAVVELVALGVFLGLQWGIRDRGLDVISLLSFSFRLLYYLMPILILYLVLALRYHFTGTLMAGLIFTLSAVLIGTTDLGVGIWHLLPWAWPIRLTYDGITDLAKGQMTLWSALNGPLLIPCLLTTLFLLALAIIWYNKWEGKASMEE